MRRYLFCLLLVSLGLYGCVPFTPTPIPPPLPLPGSPPRACSEIEATELRALMKSNLSQDETRARIAEIYDLSVEQVNASSSSFSWATHGMKGLFLTKHPYSLTDYHFVSIEFRERLPSMDWVLECLGTPDSYGAWFYGTPDGDPILAFRVFYEQEGISALWSQSGKRNQPPPINGSTLVDRVYYFEPNPVQGMVEGLAFGISDERRAKIKPWPGSWDKIEIDIEPTAR